MQRSKMVLIGQLAAACDLSTEDKNALIKEHGAIFAASWLNSEGESLLRALTIPERYFDISHWSTAIKCSLYCYETAISFLRKIFIFASLCGIESDYYSDIENLECIVHDMGRFDSIADSIVNEIRNRHEKHGNINDVSDKEKRFCNILNQRKEYGLTPFLVKDTSIIDNEDFSDRYVPIEEELSSIPVKSMLTIEENRKNIEKYFSQCWLRVIKECITDLSFIEIYDAIVFINEKNRSLKFDIENLTVEYAEVFSRDLYKQKQSHPSLPQRLIDLYEFEISRIKTGKKYLTAYLRNAQRKTKEEIAIELGMSMNKGWKSNVLKYVRFGEKKACEMGLPALAPYSASPA